MDLLLLRRSIMQKHGSTPDYVMDGLVFWMDGIDKGSTGIEWIDLVNRHTFTNYGAVFNSNNVQFNGTSAYLDSSTGPSISSDDGTVECAYELSGSGSRMVFMPDDSAKSIGLGFIAGSYGLMWSSGQYQKKYTVYPNSGIVSLNSDIAIGNGSIMTNNGQSFLSYAQAGHYYIGKRANRDFFNGKIYSIRIYNRRLTQSEILHNQSVDNNRFNLGLSI